MEKLEAILFDLDGTLLDSANDIRQGINLMLKDNGLSEITLQQTKDFVGDGAMELCRKALLAVGGEPGDDLMPFVRSFINHYRHVKPDVEQVFPHVRDCLEMLKAKGIKMGICTNKPEIATVELLKQLRLDQYFGFVAGGDTFQVHKPNAGHVLGVLEALKASPARSIFVGDGPNDVISSARAGVKCIVVTHGYSRDYENLGADKLIAGFDGLAAACNTLGFNI